MEPITWPQLIVLMSFGNGTADTITGEVRVRDVTPIPDDVDDADLDPREGPVIAHPTLGRATLHEYAFRVYRRGSLLRRETLDGRVVFINGADTKWVRYDEDDALTAVPHHDFHVAEIGGTEVGGQRPSLSRWDDEDFGRLLGSVQATEFLGRPAWAFELAPPPHKPYPLQIVVDAATGVVLRQGNAGFDSFAEWTSLEFEADVPDDLFVWTGPVKPPVDHESEIEQELGRRRAWLAERGVGPLRVVAPVEVIPHEWDDGDGSFFASFDVFVNGALARRPASEEPWPVVDASSYEYSYRWRDGSWEWYLACDTELTDSQLADVRAQLR